MTFPWQRMTIEEFASFERRQGNGFTRSTGFTGGGFVLCFIGHSCHIKNIRHHRLAALSRHFLVDFNTLYHLMRERIHS